MTDAAHRQSKPFEISHRSVLAIAVPMTLAYISTPLLGLVDTAVVGQFGSAALLGGLAVGSVIIALVFTTFNFLRSGTTGLVAQAVGADDEKEKQAILFRALAIAILSGMAMVLLSPVLLWLGLFFMQPTEAVEQATSDYFLIRMLSAPFALANYAVLGWLIGIGRSGLALVIQALLNGTNILLSLYLGLVLEWQIEGVAIATVISEAVTFVAGLALCWNLLDRSVTPSWQRFLEGAAWKRLLNLNVDIMIRSFALLFAFAYFAAQGAGFGEVTLAANAVLMQFFLIAGYFLDGLATAAEQICGRAVGANYRQGFWKGFKLTLFWNFAMAMLCSGVFLVFGPALIDMLSTNADVRATANTFLLWAALVPLSGAMAFQLDGVFIGATWSRDMSIMMVISLALYILLWQFLKVPLENHGLWLCLHAFLMFRGLTLGTRVVPNAQKTFQGSEGPDPK